MRSTVAKRSNRTGCLLTLVALLILALPVGIPRDVGAIGSQPPNGGNCATSGLRYAFSGAYWNPSGPVDNRYGYGGGYNAAAWINAWELIEGPYGAGALVDMIEAWGEIVVTIEVPAGGVSGTASCSGGYVKINPNLVDINNSTTTQQFRAVLQHEIGHTMGLNHTQKAPAHDGKIPVMATCLSGTELANSVISQDDASAMEFWNGTTSDNVVPNTGFERAGYAMGASGTTSLTWYGTALFGDNAARWRGGHIQTVANASSNSFEAISASAWIKDQGSLVPGGITLQVFQSRLRYATNTTGCSWSSGYNESVLAQEYSWALIVSGYKSGTTSWSKLTTPAVTSNHISSQLLLRIKNSASSGAINVDQPELRFDT